MTNAQQSNAGAVIVAAGSSRRMDGIDKLFAALGGKPVLARVLETFEGCPDIRKIVLVLSAENLEKGRRLADENGFSKVAGVYPGGERRQDSVLAGLEKLEGCEWAVIHDGARPLVTGELISKGLEAARETGSAIAAVPVTDTIKMAGEDMVVQGTPLGEPNADIEHVVHVIHSRDQLAAITNLLLVAGDDRALVFMTTRLQVGEYVERLSQRGFSVGGLSGEMSQTERSRTLSAFRRGAIRVLVATDVAARGIDVQDVKMVIHAFPPRDAEALIHRSGRTGRAGQQGRSVQLVTPMDTRRIERLFATAGLRAKMQPVPGPKDVYLQHERRLAESLNEMEGEEVNSHKALAERLLKTLSPVELVARLLSQVQHQLPCEPEHVAKVELKRPPPPHKKPFPGSRVPPRSKKSVAAPAERGKRPPPRQRKPGKAGKPGRPGRVAASQSV